MDYVRADTIIEVKAGFLRDAYIELKEKREDCHWWDGERCTAFDSYEDQPSLYGHDGCQTCQCLKTIDGLVPEIEDI